jgi:hypothetical protein
MPVKVFVRLVGDNARKIEDGIKEDKEVTLQFTPAELVDSGPDLSPLLLTPNQAKIFRAAKADGADFHLKLSPAMIRMQTGGGFWDSLKSFGSTVLKSAAQGAIQGAVNHLSGSDGGGVHLTHVHLTDSQKSKIRDAYKKGKSVKLRLKREHMDGSDKIPLGDGEHRKFHSAKKSDKGVTVEVEHHHLVEKGGDLGDILKSIIPIAAKVLPMFL